ncbi:MAG TPA: Hsp20/alpha crystallin family protein [Burkholderiales bacterium]|nr:Hsp20/alpha crystallin family protein [Burkholderiales bacterium]
MRSRDLRSLMWGEALSLLEQAERLQRQFFRVGPSTAARAWEPPVDLVESGEALRVHVALPGVGAESVAIGIEPDAVTVSALRAFPACDGGARIHRLEIPYGRFERRIALPMQALELTGRSFANGLLTLTFAKRKETA